MTATFSKPASTENGVLREAKYIVDGNDGTFGMILGGIANGDKVTITLPAVRKAKGLIFTVPIGYNNSYPRKFEVRTSSGGSLSTRGTFTGGTTCTAAWAERDVLTIEIIAREATPSAYWGINTLTVQ